MQIDGSGVDLVGLYALAILVNVTATLWASGVALRLRSIQGGPLMQLPIFLILFLAPVYVPLDLLSGWIHAVATVNPVTALLEAGRGFISGDPTVIALAFGLGDRPADPLRDLVAAGCGAPKPPAEASVAGQLQVERASRGAAPGRASHTPPRGPFALSPA